MRYFKNVNDGQILSEDEYNLMLVREYIDEYTNNSTVTSEEFKEENKDIFKYIEYRRQNDTDTEFIEVDENGNDIIY